MTTSVKIVNDGHYPVVVNVIECENRSDKGKTVQRYDVNPGEQSPSITIYGDHKYVNVFEAGVGE